MIEEFFANPRQFVAPSISTGRTRTVHEFYEQCIARWYSDEFLESVRHWHGLLCQYAREARVSNAILPIRLWENLGPRTDLNGVGNGSRRRALTVCSDGFAYAFTSNSFARTVYSMVIAGVRPTADEFRELMATFRMRLGFHWGNESADEREIAAYPIAYSRRFYLDGWYLAHIHGVGDETYSGYGDVDVSQVFPVGRVQDWHKERFRDGRLFPVRRIMKELTGREKNIAIAHFLRFLDPLNYFLVPGERNERHRPQSNRCIGEERCVRDYMDLRMADFLPSEYEEFCRIALIDEGTRMYCESGVGVLPMEIAYGERVGRAQNRSQSQSIQRRVRNLGRAGGVVEIQPKAIRRMQSWAERIESNAHRVLSAFCNWDNGTLAVNKINLQQECLARGMTLKCYKASLASMFTDRGNSYGRVFEEVDECRIGIVADVRDEFVRLRERFERR